MSDIQTKIQEALKARKNLGEMQNADAVGTAGSPDCGDMLRMWLKFREDDRGRRVIDRATFQSFGCETAIAVASVATELLAGRTPQEALELSGEDLAAPLGALPPMKIHCAQLVEGALRSALGVSAQGPLGAVSEANRLPGALTPEPSPRTTSTVPSPPPVPSEGATTLLARLREGVDAPAGTPGSKLKVILKPFEPAMTGDPEPQP
jgi:nitrogen fixation NifU-like protein